MKCEDFVVIEECTEAGKQRTITGMVVNVEPEYVEIDRGAIDTVFYVDIVNMRTLGQEPRRQTIRPSLIGVPRL